MMNFPSGPVPIKVAASVFKKDPSWVRAGIIAGWLPIGVATRDGQVVNNISDMRGRKGRIAYYISPKLLYDLTGYIYGGDENEC